MLVVNFKIKLFESIISVSYLFFFLGEWIVLLCIYHSLKHSNCFWWIVPRRKFDVCMGERLKQLINVWISPTFAFIIIFQIFFMCKEGHNMYQAGGKGFKLTKKKTFKIAVNIEISRYSKIYKMEQVIQEKNISVLENLSSYLSILANLSYLRIDNKKLIYILVLWRVKVFSFFSFSYSCIWYLYSPSTSKSMPS